MNVIGWLPAKKIEIQINEGLWNTLCTVWLPQSFQWRFFLKIALRNLTMKGDLCLSSSASRSTSSIFLCFLRETTSTSELVLEDPADKDRLLPTLLQYQQYVTMAGFWEEETLKHTLNHTWAWCHGLDPCPCPGLGLCLCHGGALESVSGDASLTCAFDLLMGKVFLFDSLSEPWSKSNIWKQFSLQT